MPVPIRKKLIEVALPLEAINTASAREKSIRHGHPSTLHLWWARRPLAAARAVIFAQMVDDPSCYVDVLRSDSTKRRRAERLLKERKKVWDETSEYARQMGDEAKAPGPEPTLDDILAELERERLFRLIESLVLWENTTNEEVLREAREEIWQSWRRTCAESATHPQAAELFDRHNLPAFHDPFAGGGALPLEAQRLGLESYASDLNPVPVLINKAMIEIPPKFAGRPPVNPDARAGDLSSKPWRGAQGLAEDVRYYGKWMRDEAEKRIGHLYPKIEVTEEMAEERPDLKPLIGQTLTVIAWLWARTVKSPNPAFKQVDVPLVSSFLLTPMAGRETYIEPIVETTDYRFVVRVGIAKDAETVKSGTKLARGANFRCVMSGSPIEGDYIKAEGKAGRLGARLMAIVAEGERGRVYLSPTSAHEEAAKGVEAPWMPEQSLPNDPRNFWTVHYGLKNYGDLFTARQLAALTTFADLVGETIDRVRHDAIAAGLADDQKPLMDGGVGVKAYAESVATYLGFLVGKLADKGSTLCTWDAGPASNKTASGRSARVATVRVTFGRQALPMTWDYAEVNFFSDSVGSIDTVLKTLSVPLDYFPAAPLPGRSQQADAQSQTVSSNKVISSDPPYYDNIGYADLSDFFYVWLRRSLHSVHPQLFTTLAVPKAEELVATPYRHGSKEKAETFFLEGMTQAMGRLAAQAHPAFPVTIYYAFKQSESQTDAGTASTGWETFLEAVIRAGFGISGTWPMRTEMGSRMIGRGTNALASSIIIVCRTRPSDAPTVTRRDFVAALQRELPNALRRMQAGNIAPVDLAQASIGPGMAVFTRYSKVLDAQGKTLSVREALALINETLDTALAEQEGDFDADSRWALAWFDQHGFAEGDYGVAETLSKAKNTSVHGLAEAGILASSKGKVRLLKPEELPADWSPANDARLTHWEAVHHLIRVLTTGGESMTAELVKQLGPRAETSRELAYRLYTLCERRKRAAEALNYNALVQSWPEIMRLAHAEGDTAAPVQQQLL
jgi:putative DNA methylase